MVPVLRHEPVRHHLTVKPLLLHILSLDTIGGVEQLFVNFIAQAQAETQHADAALITGGRIHSHLRGTVEPTLTALEFAKFAGGFKLPKYPAAVRRWNQGRLIGKLKPDLGILWNRFGNLTVLRELRRQGCHAVYYEHGMAWLATDTPGNREFIAGVDSLVCASQAARRVLELRWNWPKDKQADVVLNCLRPAAAAKDSRPRTLPTGRPLRLGIAARLIPLKGIGVVLHTLEELKRRGHRLELGLAGAGPLRELLAGEAKRLGVEEAVTFHDCIADMAAFYQGIDLLLVPSVREPFGLVILEAGANGCPAIGAKVDGVPEAILDGLSGLCLRPTIDLKDGLVFGGQREDFPKLVYDPETDTLVEPRFLDPKLLADAVEKLLTNADLYARMSARALQYARENSVTEYARKLRRALQSRL
jgi:glycosyltransferase involved in cell wall biosynthesis